jgi:hypothetical protein
MVKKLVTMASLGVAAFMGAGCGSSGSCKQACQKIAECLGVAPDSGVDTTKKSTSVVSEDNETDVMVLDGGLKKKATGPSWTCTLSQECSALESCYARCFNKASCSAITGDDPQEALALRQCQEKCLETTGDGGITEELDLGQKKPKKDGSISSADGCVPNCEDRECGDDDCGGTCGLCILPETCGSYGTCGCTPKCSGKECGSDGCGGKCGTCSSTATCDSYGQCISNCTPECSGRECGSDGCGGKCGTCSSSYTCDSYGQCISTCTPKCSGKECGSDGCGGKCGTCSSTDTCDSYGLCQPTTGCGAITDVGCCSGATLKYCSGTTVAVSTCASSSTCGWNPTSGYYDCATSGGSDPSGNYPKSCP